MNSKLTLFFVCAGAALGIISAVVPLPASASMAQEILNAHNKYRSEVGVTPLIWSNQLAAQAEEWAKYLSENQAFKHSQTSGQGENLWMGTSGRFSYTQMVDAWGSEKKYFKYGTFPNVSSTGNWTDVGHYTQIVWKNTTEVGCAGVDGRDGNYRFVCRYVSPGNFRGQKPF